LPHEINLRRGLGVGPVNEVAQGALQGQGFGGEGAGGGNGAGVFVAQCVKADGGQRLPLAPEAFHFAEPGIGIQDEKVVAGLCDAVFHSQPVEQRALGLLLAAGECD